MIRFPSQSCHISFFLSQIAIYNYIINYICKNMEPKSPIKVTVSIRRLLLSQLSSIIYLGLSERNVNQAPLHARVRQFCIEKIVCKSEQMGPIFRCASLRVLQIFCFVFVSISLKNVRFLLFRFSHCDASRGQLFFILFQKSPYIFYMLT